MKGGPQAVAALNVYKKVAVIRRSNDSLAYEDVDGTVKTVTDLGTAASTATPTISSTASVHGSHGNSNNKIHDIPVPQIRLVETYETDIPNNYKIQSSFVRYHRPSREEWKEAVEYVADSEDESWVINNTKFGGLLYPPEEEEKDEVEDNMMIATGKDNDEDDKTNTLIKEEEQQKAAASPNTNNNNPIQSAHSNTNNATNAPPPVQPKKKQSQLPLAVFEHMMDLLEKATAFDAIVSTSQAEQLIHTKIPQMNLLFPSNTNNNTSSNNTTTTKGGGGAGVGSNTTNSSNSNKAGGTTPTTTATTKVTTKQVIHDIYQYWVQKRSKLKRPLLRRFWPVTSTDDTNPHLVFRPREKEKYKLRKTRRNDLLSYNKMKQLRNDFENLRLVLDLVRKREQLYREQLKMQCDAFQQKIFDITDTSGKPRLSSNLQKRNIDDVLAIPTYFDINTSSSKRGKRGRNNNNNNNNNNFNKASSLSGAAAASASAPGVVGSRSITPVPLGGVGVASAAVPCVASNLLLKGDGTMIAGTTRSSAIAGTTDPHFAAAAATGAAASSTIMDVPRVIAGQNFGEPAPNFLQPLATRESYVTSWDDSVPHFTSYIEAQAAPTYRFRHRPRVGRGGRVIIDRLPCPTHPQTTAMTFFTAGKGLSRLQQQQQQQQNIPGSTSNSMDNKTRLLDLLPEPLDRRAVSRRIEELSLAALQEDMEIATGGGGGSGAQGPGGVPLAGEENDGEQVLVKLDDWLDTDEQPWGEERYAIGPV